MIKNPKRCARLDFPSYMLTYMHVCEHTCINASIYACMLAYMHICWHICMYAHIQASMLAPMHVCSYTCMCASSYACMLAYMNVCEHLCPYPRMTSGAFRMTSVPFVNHALVYLWACFSDNDKWEPTISPMDVSPWGRECQRETSRLS